MRRFLLLLFLWSAPVWADTYSSAVLADSPVNYWRLNDTSGTSAADSGSAPVTGTYNGTPTLNQNSIGAGASAGASVSFVGAGKYVTFADATNAPFNPNVSNTVGWTAEIWTRVLDSTGTRFIMGRYKGASNYSWQIFSDNTPITFVNVYKVCAGNTGVTSINGPSLTAGFHQFVVTTVGDGTGVGTMTYYTDGVSRGTATSFTICTANSNDLRIGVDGDGSFTPNQGAAEAAIYTTALSSTRVLAHFNAASGTAAAGAKIWPYTVMAPELPRFRNPGYFERFVSDGYNTGLFSSRKAIPQFLNVGYLPFGIVPNGLGQ